jgi:hypothetical protein
VDSLVDPQFRIDVQKIHELVSTCEIHEIAEKCGGKIDSILVGRNVCSGDLFRQTEVSRKKLELDEFMESTTCRGVDGVTTYPDAKDWALPLSYNRTELREYFHDGDERCAVISFPYTIFPNFHRLIDRNLRGWKNSYLPEEDVHIFADVVNYVQRPKFMKSLVDDFVQEQLFGGDFIAVHYRFDEVDFLARCNNNDEVSNCQKVLEMKSNLTEAAETFLDFLEIKRAKNIQLKAVYLASPPQEVKIHNEIKDALKRRFTKNEVLFFDAENIAPYYTRLENTPKHLFGDIMSSLEQEICMRSRIFLEWIKLKNLYKINFTVKKILYPLQASAAIFLVEQYSYPAGWQFINKKIYR